MKHNLMNKWAAAFGTLMIALTLSFSVTPANGQQNTTQGRQDKPPVVDRPIIKLPMPTKVALKCEPYNHSDVSAFITITNNSGQAIPQGTTVSWQLKGKKGTSPVSGGGLQPNKSFDVNTGLDWTDNGPCSAFYMKK